MPSKVGHMLNVSRVMQEDIERAALGSSLTRVTDASDARHRVTDMRARWVGDTENVYRVFVGDTVEVCCLGLHRTDKEAEGIYGDITDLPEWMQERIAVLSLIKVNPPQTKIDGIGMRVDEHVYWILKGS